MNTTTNNIFETASKNKFRYPYKGMITTEELWDLSLPQLDSVYKNLVKELNTIDGEDSLLFTRSQNYHTYKNEVETKIDIVRFIFTYKQEEYEAIRIEAEKSAKKQHILDVLAAKQESEEDLKKMLDELG